MPIPHLVAKPAIGDVVGLGSILFNGDEVDGVEWSCSALDGWDSPALRDDLADRPLAHGTHRGTSYYGARELTLRGLIDSRNGHEPLRAALDQLVYETDLTDVDGLLTRYEEPAKQIAVRRAGRPRWECLTDRLARFEIDLSAADPRKYGVLERTLSLTPGGSGAAVNGGRFRAGAPLVATFRGPLTSPSLSIAGVALALSTVASGETVVVDTLEGTVLLGASTAYSRLTSSGPFPTLPPNASTPVYLSGSGAGSVDLAWRDTWL